MGPTARNSGTASRGLGFAGLGLGSRKLRAVAALCRSSGSVFSSGHFPPPNISVFIPPPTTSFIHLPLSLSSFSVH